MRRSFVRCFGLDGDLMDDARHAEPRGGTGDAGTAAGLPGEGSTR